MNRLQAGARALRVWMAAEGISVADLSQRTKRSREHLSNLRHGKGAPGRSLALELERISGGAVPAGAWDPPSQVA